MARIDYNKKEIMVKAEYNTGRYCIETRHFDEENKPIGEPEIEEVLPRKSPYGMASTIFNTSYLREIIQEIIDNYGQLSHESDSSKQQSSLLRGVNKQDQEVSLSYPHIIITPDYVEKLVREKSSNLTEEVTLKPTNIAKYIISHVSDNSLSVQINYHDDTPSTDERVPSGINPTKNIILPSLNKIWGSGSQLVGSIDETTVVLDNNALYYQIKGRDNDKGKNTVVNIAIQAGLFNINNIKLIENEIKDKLDPVHLRSMIEKINQYKEYTITPPASLEKPSHHTR